MVMIEHWHLVSMCKIENYSQSYGAFQVCGELMSKQTAMIGIWCILLGLPAITLLLWSLNKIKDRKDIK